MKINREFVRQTFDQYVSEYSVEDPKIKLKVDHTYRVAGLAETIAESIGADRDFSWLCGILHDIGRFEQVKRFQSFDDVRYADHAEFGADLLFHEGLIRRFDLSLSESEMHLLELCIRSHSAYRLPNGMSEREVQYCSILRDADKIDILRVHCDTPVEEICNVTTEQLKKAGVSKEVKQCFLDRTAVLKDLKKTPADHITSLICLTFELVFPISGDIVRQQGYLDRLLAFESDDPDTRRWFAYMQETVLQTNRRDGRL